MSEAQVPRSVRFRLEREQEWLALERIVSRALNRGLRVLTADELQKLPRLYRDVLSSLSVARNTALDRSMVEYLESLAARAYLVMYGARRIRRGRFAQFLLSDFPRLVRGMSAEIALSLAFFLVGAIVAYVLVRAEASWYYTFLPVEYAGGRDPSAATETLRETLYGSGDESWLGTFSSFLFTNNARIGMTAFALGFAAGVPTALLLFINGLILGAFFALFAGRGLAVETLGWLLPHGVPEITAVILCGAAGFHIGRALIAPGSYRVSDALVRAGKRAAVVVGGAVALFGYAALVEGVFRQVVHDEAPRFAMAAFNTAWLFTWLGLGGRRRRVAR